MIRELPADEDQLTLPQRAKSHDGYEFWPSADRWRLSKDVNFGLTFLDGPSPEVELGFRLALTRYAEEHSARHTQNMRYEFQWFIRDTGTRTVSAEALINWRAQFDDNDEWKLGALKGFLLAWNGWGFPGVSDDVATLLRDWRIRGNEKGRAVAQTDPHRGPYTDVEQSAILEWANAAVSNRRNRARPLRVPVDRRHDGTTPHPDRCIARNRPHGEHGQGGDSPIQHPVRSGETARTGVPRGISNTAGNRGSVPHPAGSTSDVGEKGQRSRRVPSAPGPRAADPDLHQHHGMRGDERCRHAPKNAIGGDA